MFFDRKGDEISDEKATNFVVLLQSFILIDLFIIIKKVVDFEINTKYYNKWIWGISLALIIGILGHLRYKKKFKRDNYSYFINKWTREAKQRKIINGWLIILFLIIIVFVIPLTSVIKL
jgi:hypothetical protein